MSATDIGHAKEEEIIDNNAPQNQVGSDNSVEDLTGSEKVEENPLPSSQQEAEIIKKKYGGLLPNKHPLIAKDHERAYFDSADWALGKQGGAQKPKEPREVLLPKLLPTPHHQARSRSAYAPADDGEVESGNNKTGHTASDNQTYALDDANNDNDSIDRDKSTRTSSLNGGLRITFNEAEAGFWKLEGKH